MTYLSNRSPADRLVSSPALHAFAASPPSGF
jgi:hypothetical protein